MSKYIALLRGINVGGHKKIKMADLRYILSQEGYMDVQTYIQSGNIIFSSTESEIATIAEKMERIIEKHYGFHVPTHIITHQYLISVLHQNPYKKDDRKERKLMNFAFMYTQPITENIAKLTCYSYPNEEIILANQMIYCYYGAGAAKAKFTGNFMEKKLNVTLSSRNYNTVLKLIEMSKP